MQQKNIILILVLLVFVIGGVLIVSKNGVKNNNEVQVSNTEVSQGTSQVPQTKKSGFSLADVSQHKDATSCWAAINGKVYDLTEWIKKHPGGEKAILFICGKDGSSVFNGKHGGQEKPEQTLEAFLIGNLI